MNYIERVAHSVARHCDDPDPDPEDMVLYRMYALLALAKGEGTTAKDVHDAWSAWRTADFPDHRSLIPFEELAESVQRLDDRYVDAIHAVARELV